jgi:hypothetical protein
MRPNPAINIDGPTKWVFGSTAILTGGDAWLFENQRVPNWGGPADPADLAEAGFEQLRECIARSEALGLPMDNLIAWVYPTWVVALVITGHLTEDHFCRATHIREGHDGAFLLPAITFEGHAVQLLVDAHQQVVDLSGCAMAV